MTYYSKHIFFCLNQREAGKQCCQNADAKAMCEYTKAKVRELGLSIAGGIRVNQSGCLGRCSEGPVLVIYPEGIWYTYQTVTDIDEIIEHHLKNGQIIERLRLP